MLFTVNYRGQLKQGLLTSGRGEDRWCINAIAALLDAGHEVCLWSSHVPEGVFISDRLINSAPAEKIKKSVLLTYTPSGKLIHVPPARFYVYNFYEIPGFNNFPNNCIVSQSYDIPQRTPKFVSKAGDKYFHLPHPAVRNVDESKDNFNCKRITWTARYMFSPGSMSPEICRRAIEWVAGKISQDKDLEFFFLAGDREPSVESRVWNHKFMGPLKQFKDRVKVFGEIPWGQVLDILRDTKLIVNMGHYNHTFGGSTLEAASFGIPSVGYAAGPFTKMSGYIKVGNGDVGRYLKEMDKLYNDHNYYRSCGDKYREFVKNNYTFNVFEQKLISALKIKGIT